MTVTRVTSQETRELRHLVLWPHLAAPSDCIIDIDDRTDALHFGVKIENTMVAVGSFFQMATPKLTSTNTYRLRAMAVHPDYRGQNHGQALIHHACIDLRQKNIDMLWCDARLRAVPFYQRLGFELNPEIYEVPLIGPHQFMWLKLC